MWCAHTARLRNAIATVEPATNSYPKIALREKTGMTSEITPNAGSTMMYTSGWPNDQKKCCQRIADPPLWAVKKCPPSTRSIRSIARLAFSTGSAARMRNEFTKVIHVKSGRRVMVIPGARSVMIVTMKLMAAPIVEIPSAKSPRIQ